MKLTTKTIILLAAIVSAIPTWLKPVMLVFINWAMVFRGLLFVACCRMCAWCSSRVASRPGMGK